MSRISIQPCPKIQHGMTLYVPNTLLVLLLTKHLLGLHPLHSLLQLLHLLRLPLNGLVHVAQLLPLGLHMIRFRFHFTSQGHDLPAQDIKVRVEVLLLEGEPVFDLLERLLVPVEHLLGLLGQAVPDGEQLWNWLLAHMAVLASCETTTAENVATSSELQPGSEEKGSAAPVTRHPE